jgi:hypothetical protein
MVLSSDVDIGIAGDPQIGIPSFRDSLLYSPVSLD